MSGLSSKECAALLGAFRGDRPEESLAAGLAALAELGIVQDRDADSPPWLVVAQGERRIALATHRALSDDDKRIVDASLGAALARAVEGEHCDRISERFDMLSSASFEGIMIHTNGVVVDANQRLADLLGCELQEVLGEQTMRRCVAPEDLPETVQRMRSGFEGAYVITGVRKDGSRFRAELQSKQGKLGRRGVRVVAVRDVSEREATLALLRESEMRLRDLAAAAFDLTVLSRDGVVVDVGDGLKELLGHTKDEMLGFHLLDFVAPSARPLVKQALTQGG
jgi:PAS domain S-box-containing protein